MHGGAAHRLGTPAATARCIATLELWLGHIKQLFDPAECTRSLILNAHCLTRARARDAGAWPHCCARSRRPLLAAGCCCRRCPRPARQPRSQRRRAAKRLARATRPSQRLSTPATCCTPWWRCCAGSPRAARGMRRRRPSGTTRHLSALCSAAPHVRPPWPCCSSVMRLRLGRPQLPSYSIWVEAAGKLRCRQTYGAPGRPRSACACARCSTRSAQGVTQVWRAAGGDELPPVAGRCTAHGGSGRASAPGGLFRNSAHCSAASWRLRLRAAAAVCAARLQRGC